MAIEVFQRQEQKYLLDTTVMRSVQADLSRYMVPDDYNKQQETYSIANLYFDTPDNELIRRSLQKPVYKEKLRLRAYGIPALDDIVFIEIKKKYRGVVSKRRCQIRLHDAYAFVQSGVIPDDDPIQNRQVICEIVAMLSRYDLQPSVYIAYERRALFDPDDRRLRVSFDTNIRCRRTDLRLENGQYGAKLLPDQIWLMEIKSAGCLPFWLARVLSDHRVFSRSFSKYGTEFKLLSQTSGTAEPIGLPVIQAYACGSLTAATS
ncbi:MAG: polyphosphate polymerase domain-containing protein [Bacillota bacterium]|nr:polyphosphate polymerase domain-containing protein [Bacillota bacterium]